MALNIMAIASVVSAVCMVVLTVRQIWPKTPRKDVGEKKRKVTAAGDADTRAAKIQQKEWENFLSYDGDRQAEIEVE